ncbi:site-specific integrase [Arthrobacter sp. HMWF013]|uniref:site-specific integrase n=1 Tax=Arthrobacter sp. HMWF013 TaxID=2056849 RepID=UPI000D3D64D1|nr:site-specific integrase [Arthrobacter sp. HMWF013]PTT69104.1 hypothetical protein DBR22_04790 [Arthrobacter sp. HMWF013]
MRKSCTGTRPRECPKLTSTRLGNRSTCRRRTSSCSRSASTRTTHCSSAFLGGTGLRYSEAAALRRRDITLKNGRASVRVSRAWKSIGKGEEIGPPKSKKGNRTVTCNAALSAALEQHLTALQLDDYVFQRPNGEYMRNSRFHKEVWQPLMGELVGAQLDRKPWIHEIRHAHCTHLLDANVPVHVVQARMGHEDPADHAPRLRPYVRTLRRRGGRRAGITQIETCFG